MRKPGAFANYRYRDDLFPGLAFRHAYDALVTASPTRADREYLNVVHLAATVSESEVVTALALLREAGTTPTASAVRALVQPPQVADPLALAPPTLDLTPYDQLLGSASVVGGGAA